MSDDRFEDLGGTNGGDARSVGERLAERDRTHPEPVRRPEVPRPGNKYAWLVGILALMGLSVLLFTTTLPHSGEGLLGPKPGSRLRAFAAPAALGNKTGEANVCQEAPCNKRAGPRPACEVRGDGIVNLCDLRRRALVLTFVFDRGADCLPQVDRTERVRGEVSGVTFATVYFSHKNHDELQHIVEDRQWRQPVAIDEDGAVANLYGVGGCPTTVFARPGGKVRKTELGNLTEDELRTQAERLVR